MNRRTSLILFLCFMIVAATLACQGKKEAKPPVPSSFPRVKLGLEVFLEKHLDLIKGKRVGLVTNPSGIDSRFESTLDLLARNPEVQLVALYGPEHGARGDAQAGEYVPFYVDKKYRIPVFSLYGQSMKPQPGMLKNIDEFMRSFDILEAQKIPEKAMVKDIDVMVYDIQDVGTRVYTYIATMAYTMQACAESGIDFIVLDRPNPINGVDMEGPILEYPEQSSFVGLYPVPLRIGMTMGEMARLFNDKFLAKKAHLTVIAMEGWQRTMWYDQTSLPWVFPSPNIPSLDTATVYPGQVFFEGTNVSEGRGTTRPFELFGAPWIDGFELAKNLNGLRLAGIVFREAWFTPMFSKFQGKLCGGAQLHVVDRTRYRPLATTLNILKMIRDMYPRDFEFHKDYFDKIMGTARVREALEQGTPIDGITRSFEEGLAGFAELRKAYLLY